MYKIPANTLFMGHNLVFVPECHSTNTEASRLVQSAQIPEGSVVITDNQTKGRGQRGNSWITEPGKNLTFSIILQPSFLLPQMQFQLTMMVSLGIRDYLHQILPQEAVKIKWPNDILVNEKKVCGILIENHILSDSINYSIIGIGLNVNQLVFGFKQAGSVSMFSDREHNLQDELSNLLTWLESRYTMLKSGRFERLKTDYFNLMYWRGENRYFAKDGVVFPGIIDGVNESGQLEMETPGGRKTFGVKEIVFVD